MELVGPECPNTAQCGLARLAQVKIGLGVCVLPRSGRAAERRGIMSCLGLTGLVVLDYLYILVRAHIFTFVNILVFWLFSRVGELAPYIIFTNNLGEVVGSNPCGVDRSYVFSLGYSETVHGHMTRWVRVRCWVQPNILFSKQ